MKNREQIEIEIDSFLKTFKTAALQIHDYKKRANNIIELLEDYLCVRKEAEIIFTTPSRHISPVDVGIRYDILERGNNLPKKIQDLIDSKKLQKIT